MNDVIKQMEKDSPSKFNAMDWNNLYYSTMAKILYIGKI